MSWQAALIPTRVRQKKKGKKQKESEGEKQLPDNIGAVLLDGNSGDVGTDLDPW